ncbi:MAG: hypothetical protein HONBIEJF_00516 [Fimbriimonadaceae bacterium]|nr:hypothetical protein [Fimbriimonadaceae bacterium]
MQINLSNHLAVLAATGLAAYGIFTLSAKPAEAQIQTSVAYFPRYTDLWEQRIDSAMWGTFDSVKGNNQVGWRFIITADSFGRLPVINQFTMEFLSSSDWTLSYSDGGLYAPMIRFSGKGTGTTEGKLFTPGIVLRPGAYALQIDGNTTNFPVHNYPGMIGFWARP